ncbi:MAG: alpha/beta fold hydrolase [Pseudomonadota bacterium]
MIHQDVIIVPGAAAYPLHVRVYAPDAEPHADVLLFHGVVSHSEWLAPIARRLASNGLRVLCPDRRGVALNRDAPGDIPCTNSLIEDAQSLIGALISSRPWHFGGFCWGATYACNVAEAITPDAASLLLLAPSIFPAADIAGATLVANSSGEAICVPNVPIDRFTRGPAYEQYIEPDPLRTRMVSPRFNQALIDMNRLLAPRLAKLDYDKLVVLADEDRLSDNEKHRRAFAALRRGRKQIVSVPGEHGIQFDAPDATADAILKWIISE